jgi:hypothetical protein
MASTGITQYKTLNIVSTLPWKKSIFVRYTAEYQKQIRLTSSAGFEKKIGILVLLRLLQVLSYFPEEATCAASFRETIPRSTDI